MNLPTNPITLIAFKTFCEITRKRYQQKTS